MRAVLPLLLLLSSAAAEPTRVLPDGERPDDVRLKRLRNLNDKDFFFDPPATRQAWEKRRQEVREQVLVAEGLWPLPPRTPLEAVVHGKIDRGDYTVEKVYFQSLPGHYVTGNLYRPKGKRGKLPAVLSPHGHWANGRFYAANDAEVKKQLDAKAELTPEGARYPLQARCAQLARMGCVVFHYDMVGYADSTAITHRQGFTDADAELRLQSQMGLQTWNSIRALDFLLSRPDVDPTRVGVTGASGGGTQTFILCAIDDRPAAAFPAVMVGTAMQGGCVCENCSYLRVGTGNVELAALFAPRPLAMSGANDWTVDVEKTGLPPLKAVYKLYDAEDKVAAKCFPQFGHNYNQVSREVMYDWFNKHLALGQPAPVKERPFEPIAPQMLSVFDEQHPKPPALDAAGVRKYLTETADKQIEALRPKDAAGLKEYQRVVGTALRVMLGGGLPAADEVEVREVGDRFEADGAVWRRYLIGRKGSGEAVPAVGLMGKELDGTVVVWVHPEGKSSLWKDGKLTPEARRLLDGKAAIFALDCFGTGELTPAKPFPIDAAFAGYTFGYNRPLLANRAHDILTAVAAVKGHEKTKRVHLLGIGKAGPWVVLARGLCGDAVARTAADADRFRFENVRTTADEMMLPGALKYGGLYGLAAVIAPGELFLHNHRGTGSGGYLKPAYEAAGAAGKLTRQSDPAPFEKVAAWLLRGE
jgi:dienelactone hydrolase